MRVLNLSYSTKAIFINAECEIEMLLFSIHDSYNNTMLTFLTAYFNIVCMTFVDRLQLSKVHV